MSLRRLNWWLDVVAADVYRGGFSSVTVEGVVVIVDWLPPLLRLENKLPIIEYGLFNEMSV